MPGTALVGPLPTIVFDGWTRTRIAYRPPRNTLDPRVAVCTDHHPACDCREGLHAENAAEARAERRELETAVGELLRGHVTYAYTRDGALDESRQCCCTGCRIARRCHIRPPWVQHAEGVPLYRPEITAAAWHRQGPRQDGTWGCACGWQQDKPHREHIADMVSLEAGDYAPF